MKLSPLLMLIIILLTGCLPRAVQAVMVDFELPDYIAGSSFDGIDGWGATNSGSDVITPDTGGSGVTTVLNGSQSARLYDGSDGKMYMARIFDSGPSTFGTGTIVSTHMYVDGSAGSGEFYFSHDPFGNQTPAGIFGTIGGNFSLFGNVAGYVLDSGVPCNIQTNYLLEIELDLEAQSVDAYATNVTTSGTRTFLGTVGLLESIIPSMYPTSGVLLISRDGAEAIFDDVDVNVVPPTPLLAGKVGFEDPVYVAGSSAIGVDGWYEDYGSDASITDTVVLEGTKSLVVPSSARSIVKRNFGPGTTYEDGTVISGRMMITDDPAGSTAELHFSHNILELKTPAGIIAEAGGNFWTFGFINGEMEGGNGIDSGVPCLTDIDYQLEMELDLTNQTFDSYVTDLTNGGARTFLGSIEMAISGGEPPLEPGDDTISGFILVTRNGAEAIFDELGVDVEIILPDLLPGDANNDGLVNTTDAAALAANWLTTTDATWSMGDFNKDGRVDDIDATILAANWQSGAMNSVPEPSMLIVLCGLLIGSLVIRKR